MVHEGGNIEDRSVETDSFAVEPCGCESKPHPTNRGSLYIYIYRGFDRRNLLGATFGGFDKPKSLRWRWNNVKQIPSCSWVGCLPDSPWESKTRQRTLNIKQYLYGKVDGKLYKVSASNSQ